MFGQGFPWFRLWLLLGLVRSLSFGGVLEFGVIWEGAGSWLIRISGEVWVF